MKKALFIVLVVAILGGLSGYVATRDEPTTSVAQGTQSANRSSQPGNYKDGTFTSKVSETLYGNVEIAIIIDDGRITDVQFLQMPDKDDGRSRQLTAMAKPLLEKTTLEKQSDHIDFVTGATSTSHGYQESLQSALDKAAQG